MASKTKRRDSHPPHRQIHIMKEDKHDDSQYTELHFPMFEFDFEKAGIHEDADDIIGVSIFKSIRRS